jgi:tetratricopeptide (TPR) repeat protein
MAISQTSADAFERAVTACKRGQLADAERQFGAILDGDSGHFDAANLLAIVQFLRGLHVEAVASFDRALRIRPDDAEALYNRALVLKAMKRFDAALIDFERILALHPRDVEALCNCGIVLFELSRFDSAVLSFDRALAIRPDHAQAHNSRGVALHALRRFDEAVASYDRALFLKPDYVEAFNNRGNALKALERFDEALASYDRALALRPDYAEALNNRGNALMNLGRPDEALAGYDRALALKFDYAEAFNNRGNALLSLKRPDQALASYDRALELNPDNAEAFANRGRALMSLRRPGEALASYDRALAVRPGYADARLGRSFCLLLQGDFERGWHAYESRWDTEQMQRGKRGFAQPLWLGEENIAGKTILLHGEQGFGDTIQFCRFARQVAARGARVVLEVQPELKALIESFDPSIPVAATGEAVPDFDYHCPLMSLPLALKTTLATIPAQSPYLFPPPDKTMRWRERLGARTALRVGLVWAGNPRLGMIDANRIDRQRSVAFNTLALLIESADCEFYSLQKGAGAAQVQDSALRHRIIDWTGDLYDFTDTAALITNLDVVITVDTAVAHLVGALGKPLWLLNRFNTCWRWLLDREDSPWYPTARIFRQPSYGNWAAVIETAAAALRQWRDAQPHVRSPN